jgi:hypothetical protein
MRMVTGRGSRVRWIGLSAVVGGLLFAVQVSAQTMRTFTASRKAEPMPLLTVSVEFGAGILSLGAADQGELYAASLRYDQERAAPQHRFDAQLHRLDLRLRPIGGAGVRVTNRDQMAQHAVIELSPSTPLVLDVTLGAGEGHIDLGELRLKRAAVHSVATRTVIRASRPNRIACETLDLDGGAAEVITEKLGNLRCAEIRFEGGIGQTTLDLTGDWTSTLRVQARQALGTLKLNLPKDAGVRIVLDRTLASFEPTGFTKEGNAWVTPNFRSASRSIQVDVTSAVGGLEVSWE